MSQKTPFGRTDGDLDPCNATHSDFTNTIRLVSVQSRLQDPRSTRRIAPNEGPHDFRDALLSRRQAQIRA
jgi:hypothetical protein